jgi:hypothetical protein
MGTLDFERTHLFFMVKPIPLLFAGVLRSSVNHNFKVYAVVAYGE